jgi:hypothetical protein
MTTFREPKRCNTLTASVRSVLPVGCTERKFWNTYYINIGKHNYTSTRDLVKYISTMKINGNEPLKVALIIDPDSISLRVCIRALFKNNVHFKRIMKNE